MDKSTILKTFNTQFFEFIGEIIKIFPENADIATANNFCEITKKANPTILIKVWYMYIYSIYKAKIDDGNISFFFEKDYEEDLSQFANSKDILKSINCLREPIKTMGDVNQQHSMKYIQILSKLSEMYNDKM